MGKKKQVKKNDFNWKVTKEKIEEILSDHRSFNEDVPYFVIDTFYGLFQHMSDVAFGDSDDEGCIQMYIDLVFWMYIESDDSKALEYVLCDFDQSILPDKGLELVELLRHAGDYNALLGGFDEGLSN